MPALRIASDLLLCPANVLFFYAIYLSPRKKIEDLTTQLVGEHDQHPFSPVEGLDPNGAREEVRAALMRLATYDCSNLPIYPWTRSSG